MATVFEEIQTSLSIEEFVELEGLPLEAEGRSKKTLCPHHDDTEPSCHIFSDGRYHCFVCGASGDVVDFYAARRGIPLGIDAAYEMADEFEITVPVRDSEAEQLAAERREQESSYLREANQLHQNLEDHPEVARWWKDRGMDSETAREFLLGATPDGEAATIPHFDYRGRPQAIIRRNLVGNPKYLYQPLGEYVGHTFPLMVFGDLSNEDTAFLVEGPIDALAVATVGGCAIAVGGSHVSRTQRENLSTILQRYPKLQVVALFDSLSGRGPHPRQTAIEAQRAVVRDLYPKVLYAQTDFAEFAEGAKDPDDVLMLRGPAEVQTALEKAKAEADDFVLFLGDKLKEEYPKTFQRAEHVIEEVLPLIVRHSQEAMQNVLLKEFADRVGIGIRTLQTPLKEARKEAESADMSRAQQLLDDARRRQEEEYRAKVAEAQPEIDAALEPGVVSRMQKLSSKIKQYVGEDKDKDALQVGLLVVASSQLSLLPNGKPAGTSALVSAEAGRGKNYLFDTSSVLFPEEMVYTFESASPKSFYYDILDDPHLLRHTFLYPNELEAIEQIRPFLRPLLSSGKATHKTTMKLGNGIVSVTLVVNGPVSLAVPTVEGVLEDDQLFTRLLVVDLPDYKGRTKKHSHALSGLYSPSFITRNFKSEFFIWNEALRQLAQRRRVTISGAEMNQDFALDADDLPHAARVWGNFLGLMAAHSWLEQRNRKIISLGGSEVIVARPEDYAAVYELFESIGSRSVQNISDTQRKILWAVHDLDQSKGGNLKGWAQSEVAEKAELSQGTISRHLPALQKEVKVLDPDVYGARLKFLPGITPKDWDGTSVMKGFPTPEEYKRMWSDPEGDDPDDDGPDGGPDDGPGGGGRSPSPPEGTETEKKLSSTPETVHNAHNPEPNGHNPDIYRENVYALPVHKSCIETESYARVGERVEVEDEGEEGLCIENENYAEVMQKPCIDKIPAKRDISGLEDLDYAGMPRDRGSGAFFITKPEELAELAEQVKASSWAAIDLEGDLRVSAGPCGVRVLSVATEDGVSLVDVYRSEDVSPILDALEDVDLYVHGAEYDLPTLMVNHGFSPRGEIFDTLNASRAAYPGAYILLGEGNTEKADHSLPSALKREVGVELPEESKKKFQKVSAWLGTDKNETVPELTEEHARYATGDVTHLKELHEALLIRLEKLGQLGIYERLELPLTPVLLGFMARGLPVDLAHWDTKISALETKERVLKECLDSIAPDPPDKEGWTYSNPNPRAKVKRDALAALHARGVALEDTRSKTLDIYLKDEGEDEFVRTLKDYRDLGGIISRQRGFVKDAVLDGRIHCQLHPYGTETGRITTSKPNVQGLDKNWRDCIRDPKGEKSILSADLDQIELRILARICAGTDGLGDELLSVYREDKEDMHTQTAKLATGEKSVAKKSKERTIAKRVNFAIAYGGTAEGIYKTLKKDGYDVTLKEVRAFYTAFFERFPEVESWQKDYGSRDDFDTESLLGRHRTVSPILSGYKKGFPNREERLNGPIQTTGADILKTILLRLRLTEDAHPHARLLLPVHDEVLFEVDKGHEEEVSRWVTEVMTRVVTEVLGEDLSKECVSVEWGESWGGDE